MSLGLLLGLAASCVGEENENERTTSASSLDDQGESYYAGADDNSWDGYDASTTTGPPPDMSTTSSSTDTTDTGTSSDTTGDTDTDTDTDTESDDTTGGDQGTTTGA